MPNSILRLQIEDRYRLFLQSKKILKNIGEGKSILNLPSPIFFKTKKHFNTNTRHYRKLLLFYTFH